MDEENLVTVVIPNYNGMQYIQECLDSIFAGTYVPAVVVVDNGSTDGSRQLVEESYPDVTLLKLSVNTGFCHAVNEGMHLVRTPYVMLLNNDAKVEKNCIAELLSVMRAHPRIFSTQALMLSWQNPDIIDDAGDLYSAFGWAFARAKGKNSKRERNKTRPVHIFASCAGAAMYRMNVFDEIGWFDERHFCYLEDIDIGWRAQIYGYGNRMDPKAIVYHKGSAASGSRYNAFKEVMTAGNNACLLYKNMPTLQYGINAPLWMIGRAVKKRYFKKKGLGESYEQGLLRGEELKNSVKDQTWLDQYEYPRRKNSLAQEALVSKGKEAENNTSFAKTREDVIPLYLGEKIPFHLSRLPYYLSIQGQLIAGCFRRIWN